MERGRGRWRGLVKRSRSRTWSTRVAASTAPADVGAHYGVAITAATELAGLVTFSAPGAKACVLVEPSAHGWTQAGAGSVSRVLGASATGDTVLFCGAAALTL